ncbi:MAG TPA: sigma-70 family RNA polymerase sigma factor [Planctomycetota bacterium]|nr:sigma-70 family RNA polymerase sigma factor [Planctomycetota bacterium]
MATEEVAPSTGAEDAGLVRRTLAGDRTAFEELIRRYMGAVFAIALREAPAASDAEDIAQECFVRAFHSLSSLEEPAAFRGWLKRIAVNLSRDAARNRIRRGELGAAAPTAGGDPGGEGGDLVAIQPASGDPSASQKVRLEETRREILDAIAALPEDYSQVAAMRYVENLDYGEMERRLRISREALRKRLHRANLMLRKALRRVCPEFAEE